jgi:hypothetical protein
MAKAGISVLEYFATKMRLAKEAGCVTVHQQLLAVWNGLDVEIRELIDEPEEFTTVDRFRRKLEDKERLWQEKAARVNNQTSFQRYPQATPFSPRYPYTSAASETPTGQQIRTSSRPYREWNDRRQPIARTPFQLNRPRVESSDQNPHRQITAGPGSVARDGIGTVPLRVWLLPDADFVGIGVFTITNGYRRRFGARTRCGPTIVGISKSGPDPTGSGVL